jgi:hypothetical protein
LPLPDASVGNVVSSANTLSPFDALENMVRQRLQYEADLAHPLAINERLSSPAGSSVR